MNDISRKAGRRVADFVCEMVREINELMDDARYFDGYDDHPSYDPVAVFGSPHFVVWRKVSDLFCVDCARASVERR
jgi:hypothetical protein